jgi:hypothetical protein
MRRRRFRTWAKWACTAAAAVCAGVAVLARFCPWGYGANTKSGDTHWYAGVASGQIVAGSYNGVLALRPKPPIGWDIRWSPHWYWGYRGEVSPYGDAETWHAGVMYEATSSGWSAGASVLYPVVLTLIPAAILWYADRRRLGPHACKGCGYDRSGIAAEAKCPECGTGPTT